MDSKLLFEKNCEIANEIKFYYNSMFNSLKEKGKEIPEIDNKEFYWIASSILKNRKKFARFLMSLFEGVEFEEIDENEIEKIEPPESKEVFVYDKHLNFIQKFKSIYEAGKVLGLDVGKISLCCNGKKQMLHEKIFSFNELEKKTKGVF